MKWTQWLTATAAVLCAVSALAAESDMDALIEKLTLEQKLGQMMAMGFEGMTVTPEDEALIDDRCIGSFFVQIMSNYNFPDECAKLIDTIQARAVESSHGIPPFVAADQEGGVAAPIHYMMGATPTPGNMALGASGREEDAYAAYHALGIDLRACGITVNYAPAVDVLTSVKNPDYTVRSFSSDIARNGVLARGAVRGSQDAHVVACAKHFPGFACFDEDTHSTMAHVTLSEEELMAGGLAHFRDAIEAGCDMIMTVHAVYDAWDPGRPATLAPQVITGVLREQLGFDGVVLTDSMGMGGVTKEFGRAEGTVLAVEAGCDMILQVSRDVDEVDERIAALANAVNEGRFTEERINQSVRRILRVKAKYGLFENPRVDVNKVYETMRRDDLVKANERAALNGIVVVRDEANLLPVPKEGKRILVICPPSIMTRAGKDGPLPIGTTMGAPVRERVPEAVEVRVDTIPGEKEGEYALGKAADADLIIGYSLLAHQSPKQVEFIKKLLALGKPTVIVGLGVPGDLALFPEAKTFVAANSPAPVSTEAAVKVLFGEAQPGGTLPMPIGDLYPVGYALKK